MNSLYFEHEHKKKKTNLVIILIAFITLICAGLGYSYAIKKTGNDNVKHITREAGSTAGSTASYLV